jgi:ABC-2 type transport system permease protein
LVKKDLKKLIREPALLFMIVLFPIMLTLAFGTGFGAIGGSGSTTYSIGVVDLESGSGNVSGEDSPWSGYFIQNMTATQILKITQYPSNETAQADLIQGKIQAVVLISADFGQSCQSYRTSPSNPANWINSTVQLFLDSGSMFATQAIPPIVQQVLVSTIIGANPGAAALPVQIGSPSMVSAEKYSMFDFMAPGLFAFAAIFLIMTVSGSFSAEMESGILRRVNTTPTKSSEYMASQIISNMVIAIIQLVAVFGMAYLIGYRPKGDLLSFMMAFGIVAIFSLCSVGFGLITATIAKSSGAATGLAFVFIIPQMFLGTFVGSALSPTAQAAGIIVPSYYVTDALTSLFTRGAPVTSPAVLTDLAVLSAASVAILIIGLQLFKRRAKY